MDVFKCAMDSRLMWNILLIIVLLGTMVATENLEDVNKRANDAKTTSDAEPKITTASPQKHVLEKSERSKVTAKTKPAESTVAPNGDFVVKANDKVCIRAYFKVTFTVKYAIRKRRRLYIKETMTSMPDDVTVSGSCSEVRASISVAWQNSTYGFTIEFNLQTRAQKEPGKTDSEIIQYGWGMSKAVWTFDTSDSIFTNPIHPGKHEMKTAPQEHYFFAPRNRSFSCISNQRLILNEYNDNDAVVKDDVLEVDVDLDDMRIQAFDILPSGEFSEASLCDTDIYNNLPQQNVVPIIVAGCLSAIIVLIIIAYFITKTLGQSPYKAME